MTGQLTLSLPLGVSQRWRERRPSWVRRRDGGFDSRRYHVAPADWASAATFVRRHHYAGSLPSVTWSLGMFHDDELVGVAMLGCPTSDRVLTLPFPDLQPYEASIELSRFVLLDKIEANAETWLLGRVRAWLRAETGIRGVLAFSDPVPRIAHGVTTMPGHFGGIYQAGSAVYLGRATPRTLTVMPDGTVLNDRAKSKVRNRESGWRYVVGRLIDFGATPPAGDELRVWLPAALAQIGATSRRHGGVLRYAFPLDRHVRLGLPAQSPPRLIRTGRT